MHRLLLALVPLPSLSPASALASSFGFAGCLMVGALMLALWRISKARQPKDGQAAEEDSQTTDALAEAETEQDTSTEQAPEPEPAAETQVAEAQTAPEPERETDDADKPADEVEREPERQEPSRKSLGEDSAEDAPARKAPHFSYDTMASSLFGSQDPIATLKELVGSIRTRMANGHEDEVLPVERFLARQLEEAGLFSKEEDEELPRMHVVRPRHSHTFYLRLAPGSVAWGSYVRVIRIEAALNALHFAHKQLEDLNEASERDLYRVMQRLTNSVCAQAPNVETVDWSYLAMPWQSSYGPSQHGEWAVRFALSDAIESVQVPYRLEAKFRANVSGGDVAIELKATPEEAFARSAWVDGLGIVPTTKAMRAREASKYAARLGLLLASYAFRASERVRRVWVAAVRESPSAHECLYSLCIDRRDMARVRMENVSNPLLTLGTLGAQLQIQNEALIPREQCFYLEDERFCPSIRHDLWELSERSLPATAAFSLGASRISGLEIHEELPRSIAAERMLSKLGDPFAANATQHSVKTIMDVAHGTSDVSVWGAAERLVGKLVDGSLTPDNTEALRREIVEGDTLTKTYDLAQHYLHEQDYERTIELLNSAVADIDRGAGYQDTEAVVYRCFDNFAERVMYNRLYHQDHRTLLLVPDAYVMAHLTLAALLISMPPEQGGNVEVALAHARRALEVSPLGLNANLALVACLERTQDYEHAREQLVSFLETAFLPQSIGLAYYRLAASEWNLGNHAVCQASYQRAAQVFPPLLPMIVSECQMLLSHGAKFSENMDEEETERILTEHGIPLAPTERTSYYLYDGATASVDAEIFPVARDLVGVLESFSGDDVVRGIRNSLEFEPDR